MTQKLTNYFINEICSKPPKKICSTNKTDVQHIDDIWFLDILGLRHYDPENNKGFGYVLVVIDNFSKFGCTLPLKKSCSRSTSHFCKCSYNLKRKPNLIETDRGKEFLTVFFKSS